MLILEQLRGEGMLLRWWPEVGYDWAENGSKKCDFVLQLPGDEESLVGVEVKSVFVGDQGSYRLQGGRVEEGGVQLWTLAALVDAGSRGEGLVGDALRLARSDMLREKVCLLLAYGGLDYLREEDVRGLIQGLADEGEEVQMCPFRVEVPPNFEFRGFLNNDLALLIVGILVHSLDEPNPAAG